MVKVLILFEERLITLLSATELRSQNCDILEKSTFYKHIKFGNQVPKDLITDCARVFKINNEYRLSFDSLKYSCRKKYLDLFHFNSSRFSNLVIRTNNSGEIYSTTMWSYLDAVNSPDSTGSSFPEQFTKLYKKIVSLYGMEHIKKDDNDPVSIEYLGISRKLTWECNDIVLSLRITYGSSIKELNLIALDIINRNYDKIEKIEGL